jgi:hypothetical protein
MGCRSGIPAWGRSPTPLVHSLILAAIAVLSRRKKEEFGNEVHKEGTLPLPPLLTHHLRLLCKYR